MGGGGSSGSLMKRGSVRPSARVFLFAGGFEQPRPGSFSCQTNRSHLFALATDQRAPWLRLLLRSLNPPPPPHPPPSADNSGEAADGLPLPAGVPICSSAPTSESSGYGWRGGWVGGGLVAKKLSLNIPNLLLLSPPTHAASTCPALSPSSCTATATCARAWRSPSTSLCSGWARSTSAWPSRAPAPCKVAAPPQPHPHPPLLTTRCKFSLVFPLNERLSLP